MHYDPLGNETSGPFTSPAFNTKKGVSHTVNYLSERSIKKKKKERKFLEGEKMVYFAFVPLINI